MKRGFTVLELTLVSTLLSVVMLLMIQALTPCLRIWMATETVSEARTRGILTHQKVFAELRASCEKSLHVRASACSFLIIGQDGGFNPVNGAPIYRQMVAYWLQDENLWRRSSVAPGLPTVTPFALNDAELSAMCNGGKRICSGISNYSLVKNGDRLWQLTLDTEVWTQKGKVRCRRQSDLYFRNGT